VSGVSEGSSCAEATKGQKGGSGRERRFFDGLFFGFGIEAVRIKLRFDTVLGQGCFGFLAHIIGVLLGVKGASVANVLEARKARTRHFPSPGKRIESICADRGFVFALEGTQGVHEGDGDVRENGGTAGGDFVARELAEQTGKKHGDVADGAKVLEIADEGGGGVFWWPVTGTKLGFEAGGGGTATAARGVGVSAALERIWRWRCEIAFHFGPRMEEIGGVPRCFLQRVRKRKKGKEMSGIRKMKEWGSD
jgi:hypothetical protein